MDIRYLAGYPVSGWISRIWLDIRYRAGYPVSGWISGNELNIRYQAGYPESCWKSSIWPWTKAGKLRNIRFIPASYFFYQFMINSNALLELKNRYISITVLVGNICAAFSLQDNFLFYILNIFYFYMDIYILLFIDPYVCINSCTFFYK